MHFGTSKRKKTKRDCSIKLDIFSWSSVISGILKCIQVLTSCELILDLMRKKRKGSETDASQEVTDKFGSAWDSRSSNIRSRFSLEDYARIKKRCKEDVDAPPVGSFKSRLAGIATAPPCGASSLVPLGRGLKRKIGCIEAITRIGGKKKIEEEYVKGDTIRREIWVSLVVQAVYEEPDCFHLIMELCSGGRLIDQMAESQFSEHRAANIFRDVMSIIKYCHEMGVVHRDIKPENILPTTSRKIKLADFGLAMRISNGQGLAGLAESPAYAAPEVLLGNYSEKVDIWSAGVLLHVLLVGVLPFQGDSLKAVFDAIKDVKLDFHSIIRDSVSKLARDLLSRMLTRDVSSRITADEVLSKLQLTFLN
ncbi:Serine/threonine-protein kinase PEPKR2 [Hibiscus syriacus]|uniref:Serine/threonine-protein kinase PEPKR2 n=1 Tax=Hibiscus syriacus TaxID=106335 RepID=A0A6A3CKU4_HIBSY|nr:Serine/threonine-protein kinase PEPKR2 [Hibiscus syriacus]